MRGPRVLRPALMAAIGLLAATACGHDYEPIEPGRARVWLQPTSMDMTVGDSLIVRAQFNGYPVLLESGAPTIARVSQGADSTRVVGWVTALSPGETWVVARVVGLPAYDDSLRVTVTP